MVWNEAVVAHYKFLPPPPRIVPMELRKITRSFSQDGRDRICDLQNTKQNGRALNRNVRSTHFRILFFLILFCFCSSAIVLSPYFGLQQTDNPTRRRQQLILMHSIIALIWRIHLKNTRVGLCYRMRHRIY